MKQGRLELAAHILPVLFGLGILGFLAFALVQQHRERVRDAPLRAEITAEARFEMTLDRVRFWWTGGVPGPRPVDSDQEWSEAADRQPGRLYGPLTRCGVRIQGMRIID
jgi:hypothetical protein